MNWRSQLPGLILLFMLAGFSLWLKSGSVQQHLAERVENKFSVSDKAWASVDVKGRDVFVRGDAPDAVEIQRVVALASEISGVRRAANAAMLMPPVSLTAVGDDKSRMPKQALASSYVFEVAISGRNLFLNGDVPDNAARTKLLAATRESLPAFFIIDQTKPAAGAPERFSDFVQFVVDQANHLSEGRLKLVNGQLQLEGKIKSPADFLQLSEALVRLPQGMSVDQATFKPPQSDQYLWSAAAKENMIVLAGFVPNPDAAQNLTSKAAALWRERAIADRTIVTDGAPQFYSDATAFALDTLQYFKEGRVQLIGNIMSFEGNIVTPGAYADFQAALGDAPGVLKVDISKVVLPAVEPYIWSAELNYRALTLSGYVPDEDAHDFILQRVRQSFASSLPIRDRLHLAEGIPAKDLKTIARIGLDRLRHMTSGTISLKGEVLTVSGEARDLSDYSFLTENRPTLPENFSIHADEITPPVISPFIWSARYDGGESIVLNGLVPSDEMRRDIVSGLHERSARLTVVDKMKLAAGMPGNVDWKQAIDFSLKTLLRMKSGRVSLSDNDISLQGEVADLSAQEEIAKTLRQLPRGLEMQLVAVTPPAASPYRWEAERNDARLALKGYFPDEASHRDMRKLAEDIFPGVEIEDDLVAATGAGADFERIWRKSLEQLARLENGSVKMNGKSLDIRGEAVSQRGVQQIEAALKALPAHYATSVNVTLKNPAASGKLLPGECQIFFDDLVSQNRIAFEDGKLAQKSEPVIDWLAFTAERCPSAKLQIAMTSAGEDKASQEATEKRAQALMEELIQSGISPARLTTNVRNKSEITAALGAKSALTLRNFIEIVVK